MIRSTTPADEAAAIAVMTLAFGSDPVARWSWPEPHAFLSHFPAFVSAFGGRAFAQGTAHLVDGRAGAALWLPPGIEPDEAALGGLIERSTPAHLQGDIGALLQQMARYHPSEPHWYLPLIGVDPARQGNGHGGALMRHALGICDRDRVPAYLESTNPRNVPLYQRLGFKLLGTIQAGSSPPLFPMLRKPYS